MASTATETRTWRASLRYARIAPRKARLVIDLIRGSNCAQALNVLKFNTKRPSEAIAKTLKSAMANADEQEADMARLVVIEARVDAGPTIPRWRPKDRGRAHPIMRKTSHVHIVVAER
jgi:large subunit ribosomal protein L22